MELIIYSEIPQQPDNFSEYGVEGAFISGVSIEDAMQQIDNQFQPELFKESLQEYIGLLPSNIWKVDENRENWYQATYQEFTVGGLYLRLTFNEDGTVKRFRVINAHLSMIYLENPELNINYNESGALDLALQYLLNNPSLPLLSGIDVSIENVEGEQTDNVLVDGVPTYIFRVGVNNQYIQDTYINNIQSTIQALQSDLAVIIANIQSLDGFEDEELIDDLNNDSGILQQEIFDLQQQLNNLLNPLYEVGEESPTSVSTFSALYDISVNADNGNVSLIQPLMVNNAQAEDIINQNNDYISQFNESNGLLRIGLIAVAIWLGVKLFNK